MWHVVKFFWQNALVNPILGLDVAGDIPQRLGWMIFVRFASDYLIEMTHAAVQEFRKRDTFLPIAGGILHRTLFIDGSEAEDRMCL